MSISELRQGIKEFTKGDLQKLVGELYKIIPKDKKNEYDIIASVTDFKKNKFKIVKKQIEKPKPSELEHSILSFVENSIQNELRGNLVFSRKDKAVWIKTVKQWYNDLLSFINDDNEKRLVLKLLEKIYYLLCFACGCEIFKNYNSFTSLRLSQTDFFSKIISLGVDVYEPNTLTKKGITLIIDNNIDVDDSTSKTELMNIFIKHLDFDTIQGFVIPELLNKIQENGYKKPMERDKTMDRNKLFHLRENHNLLVKFVFLSYLSISEFDISVKFYRTKYGDTSIERTFYTMMRLLFYYGNGEKETILKEIEAVRVKGRIKIREDILKLEEHIKKFNDLPHIFGHVS